MRGVEGRLISEQAVTGSDIRRKMVYSIRESSRMYCNHTCSFSTRFQLANDFRNSVHVSSGFWLP